MTEQDRLAALFELDLLDTPEEKEFDDLVCLASAICGTPISLVSLVDEERQWFKAAIGLPVRETHRNVSFCAHAIRQPDLFIVENATTDRRFSANALVTGDPYIRFYAGVPLQAPGGEPIGTLCVIDTVPRQLKPDQREALRILAAQVQARLELRLQHKTLLKKQSELEAALECNQKLCASLKSTNDLFLSFMSHGPFAGYIKDADGSMVFYNRYLAQMSGVSEQAWIGLRDHEIWPPDLAFKFREDDLRVLEGGVPIESDDVSPSHDGSFTYWKSFKFPYTGEDGSLKLAGISIDVTSDVMRKAELDEALREKNRQAEALAKAHAELELIATTDFLTGLSTRRVLSSRAEAEFAHWKRHASPFSILTMDLDNFKQRNDRYGHAVGDQALVLIGRVLKACLRVGDLAARLGGEEFGVLLPHTDLEGAIDFAARFRHALQNEDHGPLPLTASVGVATAAEDCSSWEQLLSHADEAMYVAKRSGKDRAEAYCSVPRTQETSAK